MATKTWILRDLIGQLLFLSSSIAAWFFQWTWGIFISLFLVLIWQLVSAALWSSWHPYSFRRPWIRRAIFALVLLGLALLPHLNLLIVFPFLEALIYFVRSSKDVRTAFRLHRSFWDLS